MVFGTGLMVEQDELIGGYPIEKLNIAMGNGIEDKVRYEDGCLYVTPASTALLVGGLNEELTVLNFPGATGYDHRRGRWIRRSVSGDGEMAAVEIEPGSAFGIN